MKILVLGAGMYVSGRGTNLHGTILPALFRSYREKKIQKIAFCCLSKSSHLALKKKIKDLEKKSNQKIECKIFSREEFSERYIEEAENYLHTIDGAIISTPNDTHFSLAKKLLEKNINLLVVKPLVAKKEEAEELTRLVESKNLIGYVEYHKRWDQANRKIEYLLNQNKIGSLLYLLVEYSQRICIPTVYFKKWAAQTNIFEYLTIHYVDMIFFLTSATPVKVQAVGQKHLLKSQGIDTFDAMQVQLEWKLPSGELFNSIFLSNWIDPNTSSAMSNQRIKIIGTKGRVESDQKNRGLFLNNGDGIEDINPYFCTPYLDQNRNLSYEGYGIESVCTFINDLFDFSKNPNMDLTKLTHRKPTFQDSILIASAIEGVQQSLANDNQWVEV